MNSNHDVASAQAHLEDFFHPLAHCPELEGQLSPADLPQLLEAGLSHVLNTALQKERRFHLEDHPGDRANGYAPGRDLAGAERGRATVGSHSRPDRTDPPGKSVGHRLQVSATSSTPAGAPVFPARYGAFAPDFGQFPPNLFDRGPDAVILVLRKHDPRWAV